MNQATEPNVSVVESKHRQSQEEPSKKKIDIKNLINQSKIKRMVGSSKLSKKTDKQSVLSPAVTHQLPVMLETPVVMPKPALNINVIKQVKKVTAHDPDQKVKTIKKAKIKVAKSLREASKESFRSKKQLEKPVQVKSVRNANKDQVIKT